MGRGAEGAHIAHIVKAFEQAGHTVILLSPPGVDPLAKIGDKPLDKADTETRGLTKIWQFISRHAPQLFFECLEIGYNFQSIPRLQKYIDRHTIDFIYERSAFFLFAGAWIAHKNNIPLLVEANEAVGIKRARKLILTQPARLLERYTLRRATAVFTVSSYLSDMLQKCSPDSRIHVLPNAIDPEVFSRPTRRDAIRRQYAVSDKIVLGFAGWFDWWDRLDLLITLQQNLVAQGYDNVVTMLIGHGTMVDDLTKQIADNNLEEKVILTGAVNKADVLDYIAALDIGVLAHSNTFGSPMVLFEMMALGKCVVAPDLAPVTDVLIDGENGLLFPQLNTEKLAEKVMQLLNDEQLIKTIGNRAKEMIMENNTWQKNAEQILKTVAPAVQNLQE